MAEQKTAVTKKKTLKLKKQAPAAPPNAAAQQGAADHAPVPASMAAGIHRAPEQESCKGMAIIAVVATLVFAALLVVQALEWQYYHQTPSAFPELDLSAIPATPEASPAGGAPAAPAPAAEEPAEEEPVGEAPAAETADEAVVDTVEEASDDIGGI